MLTTVRVMFVSAQQSWDPSLKEDPQEFVHRILDFFYPIANPPECPLALCVVKEQSGKNEDNKSSTSISGPMVSYKRMTSGE